MFSLEAVAELSVDMMAIFVNAREAALSHWYSSIFTESSALNKAARQQLVSCHIFS